MGFRIAGEVVGGRRIGRRLGFPTANVEVGDDCGMADGVYAARVTLDGESHEAMANLGRRPSVERTGRRLLEVNIFDFDREIYGCRIEVELLHYVRPEAKFDTPEELAAAVDGDRRTIRDYFDGRRG